MRSDAFYGATARQIAREFANLPAGPGFDVAPALPPSPLPLLAADEIRWEMDAAPTIQNEGGDLRASTIGYRELALASIHALHALQHQIDLRDARYDRALDELRRARATEPRTTPRRPAPAAPAKTGRGFSGLSGVWGVR